MAIAVIDFRSKCFTCSWDKAQTFSLTGTPKTIEWFKAYVDAIEKRFAHEHKTENTVETTVVG